MCAITVKKYILFLNHTALGILRHTYLQVSTSKYK
jgi:hypothetical protein